MKTPDILSPEDFCGFRMGSDRKLARWDRIVEYFYLLNKSSERIKVFELGKSTEGNPFILTVISSSENLAKMDRLKEISAKFADPRGLTEEAVDKLIDEGVSVVVLTMGLHASEVAACQMSMELAYELVTSDDSEIKKIRDEVMLLLLPSINPDGQIMVVDWYNRYLGTEYEGTPMPWLYHKYTGHDNARDGFMLTQVEARLFAKTVFREWHAQAHVDFHQMGSYGARYYIPPYCDPINPNLDPLLWREHQLYGAHMAIKLEEAGKTGIESAVGYTGYWIPSFHLIANFHNCAGMITESASVRIASPVYVHYSQLQAGRRGRPEYEAQTTFPNPWLGGWWRLRDLVEQQKISAMATLEIAANLKKTILKNMYVKAKRNIDLGKLEAPHAFIVPNAQQDPLTALKMLDILNLAGVEIHRAKEELKIKGSIYPAGTHIIFSAQPLRSYIKTLLERTYYPDNDWTRSKDGSPIRPYDMTTYTLAEFMGVNTVQMDEEVQGTFEKLERIEYPEGKVLSESHHGYVIDCKYLDSITAAVILIKKGYSVKRVDEVITIGGETFQPGAFLIPSQDNLAKDLSEIAQSLHLPIFPLKEECVAKTHEVKPPKIGMYQRYWGGNMDEGWTRWVLEKFEIPYTTVRDNEVKDEKLRENYDVLILPSDNKIMITGENREEYYRNRGRVTPHYPPEYESGIGKEGVENLKKFVEKGGTLIALNTACDFVIDGFKLPIKNVLADLKPKEFYCPGSTLKTYIDNGSSTAYGMPSKGVIVFWNSPAFTIIPTAKNEDYKIIVRYPDERMLQSGWLIGEKHLRRRAAMIDAKQGEGRLILIGFRPQLRAQTHGTFKLLFNALVN